MSLDSAQSALYSWMKRETGLEIIFPSQGKPRPKPPYGTIMFIGPTQRVGSIDEIRPGPRDETGPSANNDTFRQTGLRTAVASLNIFGDGANELMSALRDSLDRPDVVEEFQAAEIAHLDEAGPNDLTALEETLYRERSQMDLTIGMNIDLLTKVVPIESVDIEQQDIPGGDKTFTVEID